MASASWSPWHVAIGIEGSMQQDTDKECRPCERVQVMQHVTSSDVKKAQLQLVQSGWHQNRGVQQKFPLSLCCSSVVRQNTADLIGRIYDGKALDCSGVCA